MTKRESKYFKTRKPISALDFKCESYWDGERLTVSNVVATPSGIEIQVEPKQLEITVDTFVSPETMKDLMDGNFDIIYL